jgi:hypothetical protein
VEYYVGPPGQPHRRHVVNADRPDLARSEYLRRYGRRYKIGKDVVPTVRYCSGPRVDQVVVSEPAYTRVAVHDDSAFIRTALVVGPKAEGERGGSVDLVDAAGQRLAQVNVFWDPAEEHLIVDVIDVDKRFPERAMHTFKFKRHQSVRASTIVSADFRRKS